MGEVGANTWHMYLFLVELNDIFLPGKNSSSNLWSLKMSLRLLTSLLTYWLAIARGVQLPTWSLKWVRMWWYDVQAGCLCCCCCCCCAGLDFSILCGGGKVKVAHWRSEILSFYFVAHTGNVIQWSRKAEGTKQQINNKGVGRRGKTCNGEWGREIRRKKLCVVGYFHS